MEILHVGEEPKARLEPVLLEELSDAERDFLAVGGFAHAVLRNGDGEISFEAIYKNLITQVGNQYFAERAAGITSPPAQVTGMRLGTGTTAPATSGTGSALITYLSGSNAAITGGYPTSGAGSGTARRITWQASWAAGVATNSALAEMALVNDTIATDATSTSANTIARILLSPTINKGASDTLTITYQQDIGS